MKKEITSKSAKIGDTYLRNGIEVQYLSSNGNWYTQSRNCKTLEEAKAQERENRKRMNDLRWLIDQGEDPTVRYVEVAAECKIIA
jgi:hypothetical protein